MKDLELSDEEFDAECEKVGTDAYNLIHPRDEVTACNWFLSTLFEAFKEKDYEKYPIIQKVIHEIYPLLDEVIKKAHEAQPESPAIEETVKNFLEEKSLDQKETKKDLVRHTS